MWGVLLLAALLVLVVRLALWLLPSRTIVGLVRRFDAHKAGEPSGHGVPLNVIVWAVEAAARRVPKATCLTQAISGRVLMRWFGYEARLCLGVAHNDDRSLRAHAWLERHGHVVLGGRGARALTRLPSLGEERGASLLLR
jgi:transglutaminase superfamily protein